MEFLLPIIEFVKANLAGLGAVVLSALALAEAVVRLTPTQTDDGFVQRVGAVITKVLDWLKVPNLKK